LSERYEPQAIEQKWQARWAEQGAFVVPNHPSGTPKAGGKQTYVLEMLP
jgi:leucyl-tRNA synthetase